jgi:hypothetical protein
MKFKNFSKLPNQLIEKISALQSEDESYAADELVELGEEILSQLAAMGIAAYLKQDNQKEVFNDFLISLFLSNGHAYNAGPLYRWAANMIKDAEGEEVMLLRPFFWENKNGKEVLNEKVHHLASLRNSVMHGFFVLPPETNREEAAKMESIIEQIKKEDLFEQQRVDFHFIKEKSFSGQWNIVEDKQWRRLTDCFQFGELAKRIAHEYDDSFRAEENEFVLKEVLDVPEGLSKLQSFVKNKNKGAFVNWYTPNNKSGVDMYRASTQWLLKQDIVVVYFALHEQGANFTKRFLVQEIAKALYAKIGDSKIFKDPLKYIKNQKELPRICVVLHDVHIGLFSPGHLSSLFNDLYDLGVLLIATSWYYPWLNRFFNASQDLRQHIKNSDPKTIDWSLKNYLRFKGPSAEQVNSVDDFNTIKNICTKLTEEIEGNKNAIARRFADDNNYPIEYVHECFSILSPFFNNESTSFIQDEVDELYGFPKTIEESSRIYLTLGRRDLKLEYQHRTLTGLINDKN